MAETGQAMLQALMDRAEIAEVIMRYCRAVDRRDEAMLRACFHADATHAHGDFQGRSAEFCALAMQITGAVELTHHQLGQISIELDGDVAFTESYFTSY